MVNPSNSARPARQRRRLPAGTQQQQRRPASAVKAPLSLPFDQVPTGPGSFAALGVPLPFCAVLGAQGLLEAFPIQAATLADSLAGRDLLGQCRTGSGKTLAFALPIVARLAAAPARRPGDKRPRALVVVPTRELAAEVDAVIQPLAAAAGLRSATVFGGVGMHPQLAAFAAGVEIIVACPGRLLDHTGSRSVDLSAIEITVLDEADHMADVGFLPMVRRILDLTPSDGQRMLFSATLAGGVDKIVQHYLKNPASHAVATEAPVEMTHHVLVIDNDDRVTVVGDLARAGRVVVFTRTKHRAKLLARKFAAIGINAVDLHGNLSQNARTRNLEAFSSGEATVLVATDIAARGIHVDEVPLVIHLDPPVDHKAYVHRSGRTARAGAAGVVITIASPEQVTEVRGLLRQAHIAAAWSKLGRGGAGAAEAMATAVVEEARFDERPTMSRLPQRAAESQRPPSSGRACQPGRGPGTGTGGGSRRGGSASSGGAGTAGGRSGPSNPSRGRNNGPSSPQRKAAPPA